jgi:hypothetical protein
MYIQTDYTGNISDWSLGFLFSPTPADQVLTSFQFYSSFSGTLTGMHDQILAIPSASAIPPPGINFFPGYQAGTANTGTWISSASPVPVPATIWLFGSALIGILGLKGRKSQFVGHQ